MTRHRDDLHAPERGALRKPGTKQSAGRSTHQIRPADEAPGHSAREHEGYLIKELQHRLRTQIEARIRAKGLWLSFPHSTVLMTLLEQPGLSGAQLARRNSVTAQTMNGLLMPLEERGLIERRSDPENARILQCFIKPKGEELLQQGMHEAGLVFSLMLSRLSETEREEFRRILRRCIEALQSPADAGSKCVELSSKVVASKKTTSGMQRKKSVRNAKASASVRHSA